MFIVSYVKLHNSLDVFDLMHYYYQIIFTNSGANVKYIARIPKDRGDCYEAALRPVRFASICYEEHVDTDYSLPVRAAIYLISSLY